MQTMQGEGGGNHAGGKGRGGEDHARRGRGRADSGPFTPRQLIL
jgi:hypothetical protein